MRKVTKISPTQDYRPIELRHLRVAAYCRANTELEEQTSSIELQVRHYSEQISANPDKVNIISVNLSNNLYIELYRLL